MGAYPSRVVPLPEVRWKGQVPRHKVLELGPGWPRFSLPSLFPNASYPPAASDERPKLDPGVFLDRVAVSKVMERIKKIKLPPRLLADRSLEVADAELAAPSIDTVEATIAKAWQLDEKENLGALAAESPLLEAFARTKEQGASFQETFVALGAARAKATLSTSGASSVLAFYVAGLIWVAVDDLIDATAMFLVPEKIADGEVLFLDRKLAPVGFVHRLPLAPAVTSQGAPGHRVVSVSQSVKPSEDLPNGIRWMVILPPTRVRTAVKDEINTHATAARPVAVGPSYFLQLCGKRWTEWKQWHDKEQDRLESLDLLRKAGGIGGATPGSLEGQLLQPNTEYRLSAALGWRRYPSPSGAENGSGTFGTTQIARFRTASEAPASLAPYIASHEPANDEQPHYTHEGLRFDFRTKSVDEIWKRFGEQLVVRAKADLGGEVFLQPVDSSGADGFVEIGSPEWSWNEAMTSGVVPCLSGVTVTPGAAVKVATPLSPNTSYTLTVHARPLGEQTTVGSVAEWDKRLLVDVENDGKADAAKNRVVYRYALQSSRYSGFADHVAAYRTQTPVDLVTDGTGALPAASVREDAAVDALCQQLLGGPLELPIGPEVVRLWRATPSPTPYGTPTFQLLGVLVDGPEPLLRRRGDGSLRVTVQVSPGATFAPTATVASAQIVGARGSRAFLLFSPPSGATHVTLRFTDVGPAGSTTTTTQDLTIPIGATPAAYLE